MKRIWLALALACGSAAWAQPDMAARAIEVHGSVVNGKTAVSPGPTARILSGAQLRLGGRADVLLLFVSDSHRERVLGPCTVRVDARHAVRLTKTGRVVAVDSAGHEHLITTAGNSESGGSYEASTMKSSSFMHHQSARRPAPIKSAVTPAPLQDSGRVLRGGPEPDNVAVAERLDAEHGLGLLVAGRVALQKYPKDPYLLARLFRRYSDEGFAAQANDVRVRAMALGIDTSGPDWR